MLFYTQFVCVVVYVFTFLVVSALSQKARENLSNDLEFLRIASVRGRMIRLRMYLSATAMFLVGVLFPVMGTGSQLANLILAFYWLAMLAVDAELVRDTSGFKTPEEYRQGVRHYLLSTVVAPSVVLVLFSILVYQIL